ncbi:MAG: hypothetical protein R2818_15555 [Flavobacteriales bacterium]
MNQGIRQEDQQWGNEHAPALDPAVVIDQCGGSASVVHDDAIGGVGDHRAGGPTWKAGLKWKKVGMAANGRGAGLNGVLSGGVKGAEGLGWRVQGSGATWAIPLHRTTP